MRIAGICAFSRTLNTGMLTVDLALLSVVEEVFGTGGASVDLFNVVAAANCSALGALQLHYQLLTDPTEQLKDYDAILFWGDFLHSRRYHVQDGSGIFRKVGGSLSKADIESRLERGLLLSDVPEEYVAKVICFGGNLHLNSYQDEMQVRYRQLIQRLYRGAKLVLTRDPISAVYAQRYSGLVDVSHAGVDPAFLFDFDRLSSMAGLSQNDELAELDRRSSKSEFRIGYSFGRSLAKVEESRSALGRFVKELAADLGSTNLVDIQWLKARGEDPIGGVMRKISLMRSCDVIVTDTYHCAVNALREGLPVICIGRGDEHPEATRSEKKKEILFYMFNLKGWYVYAEELFDAERLPLARKRCVDLIVGRHVERGRAMFTSVKESVGMSRTRLTSALLDIEGCGRERLLQ